MDIITHKTAMLGRHRTTSFLTPKARTSSHPSPKINSRMMAILRDLDTEDVRFAYGAGHIPDSLRNVKTGEKVNMQVPFCDMKDRDLRRIITQLAH